MQGEAALVAFVRISTLGHHRFLAIVLAGATAATGWIFSRTDASEDRLSSFREVFNQTTTSPAPPEDSNGLRLNYFDARWDRVLQDLADHAELTLVMDRVPPGRFARRDRTRYSFDDCVRILNRELEGPGFRLIRKDDFLVVLDLDQARTRYARPILSSSGSTSEQPAGDPDAARWRRMSRGTDHEFRATSARVDRSDFQWASDSSPHQDSASDSGADQTIDTTTTPLSRRASREDSASSDADTDTPELPVIRMVAVKQSTAVEVARKVFLLFERRAKLVRDGVKGLPTFVVYDTNDTKREGPPLFRVGIDQQENTLIVEASPTRAESLITLLTRLDQSANGDDNTTTQIVPSDNITEEAVEDLNDQLRRMMTLRAREGPERSPTTPDPVLPAVSDTEALNLRGDIEIQAMPELGVLLIRGNKEDLDRLAPVIEQLEAMSIGSLPDIHLLELQHVNSEALAELLTSVYDRLAELRQRGDEDRQSVAFFPVVQPNMILILAPRLELDSILDLAEKLDTQLDPESEFRIFELKNANAAQVVTALDSFYEERPGLRTRVRAVADIRTNTVIVQGLPRDLTEVARLVKGLDRDEPGAVHQVRVVELNHATAEELAEVLNSAIQAVTTPPQTTTGGGFGGNQGPQELRDTKSVALEFLTSDGRAQRLIRSGFLVDVRINADPRSNALIVSAPEASMELMLALIASLDRAPAATAAIKVFALKNADAEQSVELLTTMFENTNQEEQLGVQIAGMENAVSSLIPVQFSADIRTNTVLAVGSDEALSIVEAILLRLDTDDTHQRTTTVVQLRNAPAELVSASINTYLEQQQQLQDSTEDLISNIERLRQEVIVAEDINSNSLIVSASPDYYSQIMEIITELDATPPQVVIQALLVEVGLESTDEFGIELGFQDPVLFGRSIVETADDLITIPTVTNVPGVGQVESTAIISQSNTPGFNFGNTSAPLGNNAVGNPGLIGAQGISNFSLGRQNGDLSFGGFVFSAQSDAVSILLRALAARRTLHVLSRPQIRTTHNNIASIRVGQEVPVVNGVVIDEGIVSPQIEQTDTGIILEVTPRITPDGTVAMEVYAEKSRLAPGGVPVFTDITTGNTIESQIRDISIADTVVNVPNGQTIVIGGMITKSDESLERKVPWLGDLPVLGRLFRYDSTNTARTELLIFLTPRIIYGDVDSELIKQVETERLHFIESEAEEIHGPIYSIPPRAGFGFQGMMPPGNSYTPSAPSPVMPDATPGDDKMPEYIESQPASVLPMLNGADVRPAPLPDSRSGNRKPWPAATKASGRPITVSPAVQSAPLDQSPRQVRESWVRRLVNKTRGEKTSGREKPQNPAKNSQADFDDSEWTRQRN